MTGEWIQNIWMRKMKNKNDLNAHKNFLIYYRRTSQLQAMDRFPHGLLEFAAQ